MPIVLTAFRGEQPRIIPRLLPETAAQRAINARLDDGGLTPFRVPAKEADASAGKKTIYKHGADWLTFDTVVDAAPGPVATDRLYYTGDGVPKMRVGTDVYDLAIAAPSPALTAVLGGAGSGDVSTRIYVYTWVTDFGEESEPSPASNAVDWQPGNTVTLSGFAATPANREITKQRIYRSQTGTTGTWFYLVAERAAASTDFVDNVAVDALQEPLPSADWNAPPAGLAGLKAGPNGMMAAFAGKDVYFCEPWRPHAWPEKYVQTADYAIVGLAWIGTALVIMTEGQPYLASGTAPETMRMDKLETNLPCINQRGIVDLGYAVAYPSHEGLVAARADGTIGIVSSRLFDRDSWLALSPSTFVAAQHAGRYAAFYDTTDANGARVAGAIFIDPGGEGDLIRSADIAAAAFYELESGGLFFLDALDNDIYRLDAPGAIRARLYWKSKPFILPYPENFGVIRIDANATLTGDEQANDAAAQAGAIAANAALIAAGSIQGEINANPLNVLPVNGNILQDVPDGSPSVTVTVIADTTRSIDIGQTNRPVRLPSGFTAEQWEIEVSTNVRIHRIAMAKTMDELKMTP
jgi:hypothetical protein